MAGYTLPAGFQVVGEQQAASDLDVARYEEQQPHGTRMLVQVGFAFKWPGFGVTADAVDLAMRTSASLAGLQPWPESPGGHYVTADAKGDAVWWVAYQSSPAWWIPIAILLALFILAAIAYLVVRKVAPGATAGLDTVFNLLPLLLVLSLLGMLPNMTRGFLPWTRDRTEG